MSKKKMDQIVMLGFLVSIVVGSAYLFSDDAIPPELLPSAAEPVALPTPLLGDYIEAPAVDDYVQPEDEPTEAQSLVDGWSIFFAVAALGGLGMLIVVMAVSRRAAKRRQPAPAQIQPTFDDLALFGEAPVSGEPGPQVAQRPSSLFPQDIYEVVNGVLLSRGGQGPDGPNYWIKRSECAANPLMWVLPVDYRDGKAPEALDKFMTDIESRLFTAGYDVSARLKMKPLSIEIDRPDAPTVTLRQYWQEIKKLPQNERLCAPAVEVVNGALGLKILSLRNAGAGNLVAGMPRSGKTQLSLAMILSMCMTNSPARLSLFVADLKAIDTVALDGLPHMIEPVITEADRIADVLAALVEEMNSRKRRAARRDRGFMNHSICFYCDEVAEMLISAGERRSEVVENIQRLSQSGQGLGIILILATQRVYEVPAEVYSKLERRILTRTATAGDSVAASGSPGTACNKLPGKGAAEVFQAGNPAGERAQGLFVADAESEDYEQVIQGFTSEIAERYAGISTYCIPVVSAAGRDQDDHDTATPRPVKRSWTAGNNDGWDSEPADEWAPVGESGGADRIESHAEIILGKYRPNELFDDDGVKYGVVSKCVRLIFGPDAKAAGSNWDEVSAALAFIQEWNAKAETSTSTST